MTSNRPDVAARADWWGGAGLGLAVVGSDIALFRIGDADCATANRRSHGPARLCDGFIAGEPIECRPLHQGRFDLRSGAPACEPAPEVIRTYPVRIDGGRAFVAVE